jgi:hypothetical protein
MPLQNENEIMSKPLQIKASLYVFLNNISYELKHPKFAFLYRALLHLFFNFSNYCRRCIVKNNKAVLLLYQYLSISAFLCKTFSQYYSHTRDIILGPMFQPVTRLVMVTHPLSGINDKKKINCVKLRFRI